ARLGGGGVVRAGLAAAVRGCTERAAAVHLPEPDPGAGGGRARDAAQLLRAKLFPHTRAVLVWTLPGAEHDRGGAAGRVAAGLPAPRERREGRAGGARAAGLVLFCEPAGADAVLCGPAAGDRIARGGAASRDGDDGLGAGGGGGVSVRVEGRRAHLPAGGPRAAAAVRGQDPAGGHLGDEPARPCADVYRSGSLIAGRLRAVHAAKGDPAAVFMKHRIFLLVAVLLAVLGLVLSEALKPEVPVSPAALLFFLADTQRELTRMPMQVTRLPDEKEIEIGNAIARRYLSMLPRAAANPEEQAIAAYVSGVGQRVAQHAHRRLPYRFHYVPDVNFINAFALPGGHVFIGEGLLALMTTEDALAGILGHEIEHIDHYHCAERVQIELALRRFPLSAAVALPAAIFVAGYTKDQELEADREGAKLAAAAGYSPLEVIAVFEEFDKLYKRAHDKAHNPAEEMSRVARETLEGYFQSHPPPQERIAAIRREVGSLPAPTPRPLQFQDVFLREEA